MEGGLVGSHGGFVGWWKHHHHYHHFQHHYHHRHHYHGLPWWVWRWALRHCETPDTTFPFLATLPPPLNAPPYCIRSVLLPAQNAPPSSSEPVPGAPTIQWVGRPGKPLLPPSHTAWTHNPSTIQHRTQTRDDVWHRTHNNSQYNTIQNTD